MNSSQNISWISTKSEFRKVISPVPLKMQLKLPQD